MLELNSLPEQTSIAAAFKQIVGFRIDGIACESQLFVIGQMSAIK